MPSLEHNALVNMFRENPDLAPHLVELLLHVDIPPYESATVIEASLDQLIPVEFRADLVLELRDASGVLVLLIVLEVQRDIKRRKKYSWPVYVAVVRAEKECSAVVLVVAPDIEVATWAAETIDLGLGRGSVTPLVLGPTSVPVVTDQALAERETELAILSAAAHGNGPNGLDVAVTALAALRRFDVEHAAVYFQIIYDALREPMQRALEALIMERQSEGKATFPPFAQHLIDRGKLEGMREGKLEGMREGELKGMREGELKGMREGELKGKRDTLLRLLTRAEITLSEAEHARIQTCTEAATLDRWVDNIIGATTAAEVLS